MRNAATNERQEDRDHRRSRRRLERISCPARRRSPRESGSAGRLRGRPMARARLGGLPAPGRPVAMSRPTSSLLADGRPSSQPARPGTSPRSGRTARGPRPARRRPAGWPSRRRASDGLLVDELDAADVEASRRLVEDEQLRGRRPNSRATMTFCWLPPESVPAGDVVRWRADVELARSFARPLVDRAVVALDRPRANGRPVVAGQDQVVRDAGSAGRARSFCRSAGHVSQAVLRRRGRGAPAGDVGRRPARIGPPAARRRPVSASTSSSWPLPATPAIPRISPARTSKVTPRTTSCPIVRRTRRPSTDEHEARPACDSPRSTVSWTSRPTISSARSSSSVSAGSRSPTTRPRRMTVIRSAISRTS